MSDRGRDKHGRLICPIQTNGKRCGRPIDAPTGLMELQKMGQHLRKKHDIVVAGIEALLELRAKWEEPPIAGNADAVADQALRKRGS